MRLRGERGSPRHTRPGTALQGSERPGAPGKQGIRVATSGPRQRPALETLPASAAPLPTLCRPQAVLVALALPSAPRAASSSASPWGDGEGGRGGGGGCWGLQRWEGGPADRSGSGPESLSPHCPCDRPRPLPDLPTSLALFTGVAVWTLLTWLFLPLPLPCVFSGYLTLTRVLTLSPDPSVRATPRGCGREETHPLPGLVHLPSLLLRAAEHQLLPATLRRSPLSPPPSPDSGRGWLPTARGLPRPPAPSPGPPGDGGWRPGPTGHRPGPCRPPASVGRSVESGRRQAGREGGRPRVCL